MVIQPLTEDELRELRELRRLSPELRHLARNRARIEKMLGILIDDRKTQGEAIAVLKSNNERVVQILPTLEKMAENKERVDWFYSVTKKWGTAGLAMVILVSTFFDHVSKLWAWARSMIRGI